MVPTRRLASYARLIRKVGLRGALAYKALRLRRRLGLGIGGGPRPLRLKGYEHPVYLRHWASDIHVFDAIFVNDEYGGVDLGPPGGAGPALLLDCGANVGYASLYFLNRYPGLRVIAVEPDPGNYAVCVDNLAPFGDRATVVRSAVWSHPTGLTIVRDAEAGHEWDIRVVETRPGCRPDLRATSIPELLDGLGPSVPGIDLLKIDIEGAEAAVFAGPCDWLARVKNIAIELHGEPCERAFFAALARYRYDLSTSGSLTVCSGIRPAG
jgi:FkbM family methyltransferase